MAGKCNWSDVSTLSVLACGKFSERISSERNPTILVRNGAREQQPS